MKPAARLTLRLRLTLWIGAAATVTGIVIACVALTLPGPLTVAAVLAAIAGCIGVGYVVVGRELRPLHEVTETAKRLSTETLARDRIRLPGPRDELRELADTFDEMLDRISSAFEAQRRFVSNASHELRTPLAVMRTEVDVALSNPDDDVAELRHMAEVLRDSCDRINDLIESLLWLARAEAEPDQQLTTATEADLGECARSAIALGWRAVEELELSLAESSLPAPVVGDARLLERLVGNLLENAIRHNVPAGRVWVLTGGDDRLSWLVVGNTADNVDADTLPRLFEPFSRGGDARVGRRGAGLGMSIVHAVCRAHGGNVSARALPDGNGMEVRVEIPVAGGVCRLRERGRAAPCSGRAGTPRSS